MKQNLNNSVKDIFLFACLAAMIIYAYKRAHLFLNLHTKSLIHELDRTFADQLFSAQRQARVAKSVLEQAGPQFDQTVAKIEKTSQALKEIEEKYSNNSPGLLFLGPIGSASIVLKEQQLETKLLAETINIASALSTLLPKELVKPAVNTIDAQINQNQEYINYLMQQKTIHGL
jgi:hypothetical protein